VFANGFVFSHEQEDYTMTMKANKAKEFRVKLNESLKFSDVTLRPLRWMAASLICHDTDVSHCCVYYINSYQDLTEEHKAKLIKDDGRIIFREGEVIRVAENYQDRVNLVRHKKAHVFKKGKVEAWISKVETYEDLKSPNGCHPKYSHIEVDFLFGELTSNLGHDYVFINNFWQMGLDFLKHLKL